MAMRARGISSRVLVGGVVREALARGLAWEALARGAMLGVLGGEWGRWG